jgi:hypothetical protein
MRCSIVVAGAVVAVSMLSGCSKNNFVAATPAQTFQALQESGTLPTLDVTQTVAGTDANNNGVRDDLDKYIAALPDTPAERNALTQTAQAIQSAMLVDPANAAGTASVSAGINRAVTCVWAVYPKGIQGQKVALIQELSVNTLVRLKAYEAYNASRNGTVVTRPTGNTCN